ncbi:FAD-dependent monooxygenase [Pseudonocardia broussonetiae]|uniref:FAD-dependent monooxygenase n=1 Tax=Pseudonocardia broussonetiae TaxID=2736640 RepID=UPI001962578A|nr:FAD-dependent monooxygenase [Pseudonocardia broussonetiae]
MSVRGHHQPRVIVVGAGPVGLTLAIDLGRRGIPVTVVERKAAPADLPKMERSNARTMELFRRLGIADRVRAVGLPADVPMDVYVTTRVVDEPILHLAYPSPAEAAELARATHDGSLPLESQQLVSQYALEPLLRDVAQEQPTVDLRYGCDVASFAQDADGVTARLTRADGGTEELRAEYLVGCDGGASTVRKALGIALSGKGGLATLRQVFFRSPDLIERVPVAGRARHFYFADGDARMIGTAMVVQGDQRHFTFHTGLPEDTDFVPVIREKIGAPVEVEVLAVTSWTLHLLVADRYRDGRVLLAGDSAHLVIPQGGLGMNTGIGDATDLAWKLAGTLQGWGGPGLLDSYENDRRQVALRNVQASEYAATGTAQWRAASTDQVAQDTPEGARVRAQVRELADVHQRKGHEMTGIELGYRYLGSPVISYRPTDPSDDGFAYTYRPRSEPGFRLPHLCCADGRSVHDLLGDGYSLLRLAGTTADTEKLEAGIRGTGARLDVLDLPEPHLREAYGADLLLLRPDLHVAWRSDTPPADPAELAALVTGRS